MTPRPPAGAARAGAPTVTYRHAVGYSFEHPVGWRVEQRPQGTLILPADAAVDAAGNALEMFALSSQAAPGITRADDPQVIAFVEQNAGGLQRIGAAEPLASGLGAAIVLTFEGTIHGIDARRRVYVTLHNGDAVFLLHEASRTGAPRRDDAARRLFASLAYERPASDARVVGEWRRTTNSGSRDRRGGLFTQDDEVLTLESDGAVEYGTATTVSGTTSGVSILGGGSPHVQRGRYTAVAGQLAIAWDAGGAERLEYAVFVHEGAPHLRIGPPGNGARFYRRAD